jgi:NtrC-family two-component system response regulator AlgB
MSARRDKPFYGLELPSGDGDALAEAVRGSEDGTLLCVRLDTWPAEYQRQLLELLDSKSIAAPGGETVTRQCRVTATALSDTADGEGRDALLPALMEWFGSMTARLPSLRDRREDILPAAREFLSRFALREDKDIQGFSMDAQEILRHYAWPGNLRELRSVVESAVRACPGGLVLASHLPVGGRTGVTLGKGGLHAMRTAYTREQITSLLAVYGDSVEAKRRAAKELGIGLSTLYRVLSKEK